MLLVIRRGHEDVDVLTDDFGRLVAKDFCRRRIDRLDNPTVINRDDSFHSGIQNGAQPFFAVHERQRRPGELLLGAQFGAARRIFFLGAHGFRFCFALVLHVDAI